MVDTPSLVLRGTDRNEVIIDGEFERANTVSVTADGLAVENLTVRNARLNGVFWTGSPATGPVRSPRSTTRLYGIYAFDSVDGLFEESWAAGSADAGFHIGQCDPCDAVIRDVVAERSGLGYSGTNAGGNLHIVSSTWRHNVAGIVPNTLDTELLPPARARRHLRQPRAWQRGRRRAHARDRGRPTAAASSPRTRTTIAWRQPRRRQRHARNPGDPQPVRAPLDRIGHHRPRQRRRPLRPRRPGGVGSGGRGQLLHRQHRRPHRAGRAADFQPCSGRRLPWRWDLSTAANNLGYVAEARGLAPDDPPRD